MQAVAAGLDGALTAERRPGGAALFRVAASVAARTRLAETPAAS